MRSTGIVRLVDELGRIVMPIELRRVMELNEGDPVEFFVDREHKQIMFRKYRTQECLFCQSTDELRYFKERFICSSCIRDSLPGSPSGSSAKRESAAASDVLTEELPVGDLPSASEENRRRKRGETWNRLAEVMNAHPDASQSEWARMIGISQSRVSQLLRSLK
ncbi:AbrB family transcriptional regulator [Cohnella sp. CFH 77786]|uniref:AbrB/MazE/SpoVT family DNA-binding domain-containing protein n=1 Tax=Cohnella sp. CFH 77786 TaxID=2662265 RepID=UPI001C610B0A|nr:AbrB/MazE/SpoVT family DNA-binding domain-containing protein [Cohnella sp. CFH 77786]MBW5445347.1 AbrB family transcriptional regulator [Cohnella sp. CFH 77786]